MCKFWCIHKWGEIKDGYQYCTKCNKARVVNCSHVFTDKDRFTRSRVFPGGGEMITAHVYTLQCSKCGDIISREVSV